MLTRIEEFKKFRETLYSYFNKRPDSIMNLLDALSSQGHRARSVVELSEANCFERQYSSITDAIADGLPEANWHGIERYLFQELFDVSVGKPPCFLVDCTPNPRPFAKKLADRSIVHSPNPAPGNKPICVGHSYSCVALLPTDPFDHNKKWLIPLSMQRVPSEAKGNEVGMQQISSYIKRLELEDQLTVGVGDTLYGSEPCRHQSSSLENLVHIFRLKSNRNVYSLPDSDSQPKGRGRKKEYGQLMSLSKPTTHTKPDHRAETAWVARSGEIYSVKIDAWKNKVLRGSKKFKSSQHPMTIVRVRIVDSSGNALFKKAMWLGVMGKLRDQLSLVSIYQYYRARYNLEHFFRFGKTKLLLDSYQTTDPIHDEHWWKLCLLAYIQLYMARSLISQQAKPWEKYLPTYREKRDTQARLCTASQTQRGFAQLLEAISTPAKPCISRGRNSGRKKGEMPGKRIEQKIIFKSGKTEQKIIIPGFENSASCSNPQEIQGLIHNTLLALKKFNITPKIFSKMLFDSS